LTGSGSCRGPGTSPSLRLSQVKVTVLATLPALTPGRAVTFTVAAGASESESASVRVRLRADSEAQPQAE
jgi:hypothetical protein